MDGDPHPLCFRLGKEDQKRNLSTTIKRLFEDLFVLKEKFNRASLENRQLKSTIKSMDSEKKKLEKAYEEAVNDSNIEQSFAKPGMASKGDSTLVRTLKQQNKELRRQIKQTEKEMEEFKKQLKFRRMKELQILNKAIMEEYRKLLKRFTGLLDEHKRITKNSMNFSRRTKKRGKPLKLSKKASRN